MNLTKTNNRLLTETLQFFSDLGAINVEDEEIILLNAAFIDVLNIPVQEHYSKYELMNVIGAENFNAIFSNHLNVIKYISIHINGKSKQYTKESKGVRMDDGTFYTIYRLQPLKSSSVNTHLSSDKFLQLIVDNIPQYIFWKDRNSVYQGCNGNFANVAGVSEPKNIIGKTDYDLAWEKEEADFFIKIDQEVMKKGLPIYNIVEPQLQADGKKAWLNTNKIPLRDNENNVIGILGTFEDITDRIQKEEVIQQQVELLSKQKEKLERYISSNLELENFAYVASHDMKTPLRTIISFSQLLSRSIKNKITEREQEYLKFILSGSKNLNLLIDDLLQYSRVNNQKIKIQSIKVNFLIEAILMDLKSSIDESKASIYVDFSDKIINGDKHKLRQLFQNLIANSIKFRQKDKSVTVQIGFQEQATHYQFWVKDNGIGMKEEFKEKIFLIFKRLNTIDEYEGSGIGLAICKKIVAQHEGEIWVESKKGKGSIFYFTIAKNLV